MVLKSLILFIVFLLSSISSNNNLGVLRSDELDIKIDVSNLIAEFDEKINYNLKVKDNDVNVQKIEKILPDLKDDKFFDLKVTSEKANIKKFEVIEKKDLYNQNIKKKILLIEYQLKKNENIDFENKFYKKNNTVIDIDFCICFKTKDFQVVKNKILLRDVPFSNLDKTDENMILNINLFNLPKNANIKKIDVVKNENNFNEDSSNSIELRNEDNKKSNFFHKKFDKDNSINRRNQDNNLNEEKKYSLKYHENFHKDSVSFLSINLTLVNNSTLNNTDSIILKKPKSKKENLNNLSKESNYIKNVNNINKRKLVENHFGYIKEKDSKDKFNDIVQDNTFNLGKNLLNLKKILQFLSIVLYFFLYYIFR